MLLNYKPFKKNKSRRRQFRIYLPVKLADGEMSMKKENISSYLIYNIISLNKITGKTESFSENISLLLQLLTDVQKS